MRLRTGTDPGLFITVEGVDGAGKTIQAGLLAEYLQHQGYEVLLTKEPGEGAIGAQIRQIILSPANTALSPRGEAFLYAADRAQHVEKIIRPALAQGKFVVCDRYIDSHIAYQGYGRGLDLDFLRRLNLLATDGLWPDLTILLMIDVELSLARARARGSFDRMEKEGAAFQKRLAAGYAKLAEEEERIKTVDASGNVEEVFAAVLRTVEDFCQKRGI